MRYFIDGYNFLFKLYEEVDPLREKRDEVISYLKDRLLSLGLHITIIFDSHHTIGAFIPTRLRKEELEIIYTPSDQTADQYIIELLESSKNNHIKTIVTSDRFLTKQAKIHGAHSLTISAFLDMILKKEKKARSAEKKQEQECSREFERLLEAFEKKLKEDLF